MNKFLTLFFIVFIITSSVGQVILEGEGYLVEGIEQISKEKYASIYFLIMPTSSIEKEIWDSLHMKSKSSSPYYYLDPLGDTIVSNLIRCTYKMPILIRKGLLKGDSIFVSNKIQYDINNCYMRNNRPFFTLLSIDTMANFKHILHIDKIKFSGQIISMSSVSAYQKLMCHVIQDKGDKLSVFAKGTILLTDLSPHYQEFDSRLHVIILNTIKTYDSKFAKLEPKCFIEEK